ncbi:MAG: DUF2059 domain-containing protein [Burkholderiaceae bacterium]|nr:MAG: DUF2059 domain-containing protein [Burkholderiaceae bacterium]
MSKLKYLVLLLPFLATPIFAEGVPPTEESLKQLLAVTEVRKLVDGMMNQMDGLMKNAVQQALQGKPVTPKEQKILDNMQGKTIALLRQELGWENLEPLYIRVYHDSFTQDEVDGMLAFYTSPPGAAVVKKMPVVMQKTMSEMQTRMGPLMQKLQKIQQESIDELKSAQ